MLAFKSSSSNDGALLEKSENVNLNEKTESGIVRICKRLAVACRKTKLSVNTLVHQRNLGKIPKQNRTGVVVIFFELSVLLPYHNSLKWKRF